MLTFFLAIAAAAAVTLAEETAERRDEISGASLLTRPRPMQGYYIGLNGHATAGGYYHEKDGWLPPFFGGGGTLHVGQGLTDRVALGLDLGAGSGTNGERTLLYGRFALEVKVRVFDNWFVRPSIGFGFADFYRKEASQKKILGTLSGEYAVSLGYDFFVHKKPYNSGGVALSPILWVSGGNGINLHHLAGGVGVEITLWNGLDKNQLVLPEKNAFH